MSKVMDHLCRVCIAHLIQRTSVGSGLFSLSPSAKALTANLVLTVQRFASRSFSFRLQKRQRTNILNTF